MVNYDLIGIGEFCSLIIFMSMIKSMTKSITMTKSMTMTIFISTSLNKNYYYI